MLVGNRLHARPEGETVEDRLTVPVKPLTEVSVTVEVVLEPAFAEMLAGLAVMLKS